MNPWTEVSKGDPRARALADKHYSRQHPGHPMFTRPGYNMVLLAHGPNGNAVWVWFRPKWECGLPGTQRKDKLHAIECTLFRNESGLLSSDLIRAAILKLDEWPRAYDVAIPDGLITSINSEATAARRSKQKPPGACFRAAGWEPFSHTASKRADVWLRLNPQR